MESKHFMKIRTLYTSIIYRSLRNQRYKFLWNLCGKFPVCVENGRTHSALVSFGEYSILECGLCPCFATNKFSSS